MWRWLVLVALAGTAQADTVKNRTAMGTWDCNGSKPQDVTVTPGEHVYVWRGQCSGAEGFDVVVEPKDPDLVIRETHDDKAKEIVLRVVNRSKKSVRVKMHVFVGFA